MNSVIPEKAVCEAGCGQLHGGAAVMLSCVPAATSTKRLRQKYEVAVDEIAELEFQYEQLRRADLLQQAMLLVKQRVRPSTWNAFYRVAWLDEPIAVVASQLEMPEYLIYSAKFRVQKLIQEEVRKLESREDACVVVSDTSEGLDASAANRSLCH
ncbi:MAG UNVERIFIED_CONTAM: hypothetical protein LVR18_05020 [Planctomycetaceae bacterium]